jgi:IS30 family transposase
MSISHVSDEKLLELWKDPDFDGSFRGIKTFQAFLKTDKNIDVSEQRLYKVLKNDSIYLLHLTPKRKFLRRKYDVRYYGELLQADIAYMFKWEEFQYFLLVIDCFSNKIFIEVLKSKSADDVATAFRKIFKEFGADITELQTDRGKEFLGKSCQELFKKEHIVYRSKFGKNKANFAENAIGRIKRKLYMLLRSQLNQNWVEKIAKVVESFNNIPMRNLGWLKPNDITSKLDSIVVNEQRAKYGIHVYKEPSFKEQLRLQKTSEKKQFKNQRLCLFRL